MTTTKVQGLKYISNYITPNEHNQLIHIIDSQIWSKDLKRRVQHYGYKYDYKKRTVVPSMYLGKLPDWIFSIASRLYEDKLFDEMPDQMIINEYNPGQGISNHIDCVPCFSNTIASLSLGSSCIMELTHIKSLEKISIFLEPGSLIVLQDESRYEWQHGIPARKNDTVKDTKVARERRISMTFRKVVLLNKLYV